MPLDPLVPIQSHLPHPILPRHAMPHTPSVATIGRLSTTIWPIRPSVPSSRLASGFFITSHPHGWNAIALVVIRRYISSTVSIQSLTGRSSEYPSTLVWSSSDSDSSHQRIIGHSYCTVVLAVRYPQDRVTLRSPYALPVLLGSDPGAKLYCHLDKHRVDAATAQSSPAIDAHRIASSRVSALVHNTA